MVEYKKELDHFQFAQRIIPYYDVIHKTVEDLFPKNDSKIKAIGLGIGAGGLELQLLKNNSNLSIVGIDISESILNKAKRRLIHYKDRIKFLCCDFTKEDFKDTFDCIYSVFAIHYISDDEKNRLFSKIYNSLKVGGCFIYADIFKSTSNFLTSLYTKKWKAHMLFQGIEENHADMWIEDHLHDANPESISSTINSLKCVNFSEVHSIWKYYGFAILYAQKK